MVGAGGGFMVRLATVVAAVIVFLAPPIAHAQHGPVTTVTARFEPPVVEPDGSLTIPECATIGRPGEPLLPRRTVRLVLPPGTDTSRLTVTVEAIGVTEHKLAQPVPSAPDQRPLAPIRDGRRAPSTPDAFWRSAADGHTPGATHRVIGTARSHGYTLLVIDLFPVRWTATTRTAQVASGYKVMARAPVNEPSRTEQRFLRGTAADRQRVAALVDNPWRLEQIAPPARSRADDWQYLVVTPASMVDAFAPLLAHRNAVDGLTTHIVSLEDVLTTSSGRDDAERLRSFVQRAFADHGTRYLVLGGDADVMPVRGCYAMGEVSITDSALPTDLYFGALDGDWNADGDGLWGEPEDDVDLLADVAVGRISASNPSEVQRQVAKIMAYETWSQAPFHALLLGESADATTWGGDMMDWAAVELGGAATDTLYDRDAYWSATTLIDDFLNTGQMNLITHMGHASTTSVMKLSTSQASGLTNDNPFFVYSQGCYAGAFDQGDCMAEAFTVKGDGGAHAVIMNSRYGWYAPGSNLGSSNLFHRELLEAIYERHVTRLGDANDLSRHELMATATDLGSMRWCYFNLTLFGDPATSIHWQCDPSAVRVVPESVHAGASIMRSDPWQLTAAVHDDCAGPLDSDLTQVEASFTNGDAPVMLADDGVAPDSTDSDGQYTGTWTPGAVGPVTVQLEATAPALAAGSADVPLNVVDWMGYTVVTGTGGWVATDAGTTLSGSDILGTRDDGGWIVDIGFPFLLYGRTYADLMVGTNGLIQLEHGATYSSTEESFPIPFARDDNGLLAPWWCDLDPGYTGQVRYLRQGSAPNRRLTIEWHEVPHSSGPSDGVTFQVTLIESSNEVAFRYQDTSFGDPDFDRGQDATVGIEGPNGVHGVAYAWHTTELFDGLEVLFSPISSEGQVLLDAGRYACTDTVGVQVLDTDLEGHGTVTVHATSSTEPGGVTGTLTAGSDPRIFDGSFTIATGPPTPDGVLQVAAGDTVTVTYTDANPPAERTTSARVDCAAPAISDVELTPSHDGITVSWTTSEPATATVRYGQITPELPLTSQTGMSMSHQIEIANLQPCTRYVLEVESTDGCGNTAIDDAGGSLYSARTLGWSEILLAELAADPQWEIDNGGINEPSHGWVYGAPTGSGGDYGGPDPSSGHTGAHVYGVHLEGDYDNGLAEDQLKLSPPPLDCSELTEVYLDFWRWLGVEQPSYDHARVQVSGDGGSSWSTVWENEAEITDSAWSRQTLDISDEAAGRQDVRVRWTLGATDSSWQYCGWNLDDVSVGGPAPCAVCEDPPIWQGTPGISSAQPLPTDRSGVDLQWTLATPACGAVVSYQLYLERGSSIEWSNGPLLTGLTGSSLRILGLTPGEAYSAALRAVDDHGNGTQNTALTTFVASGQLAGDATCDGTVTTGDIVQLAVALFASAPPTCALSDVDGDGILDAADLAAVSTMLHQDLY
jgi:hypothetical protein